ncbi:MAG TPA: efflux RND transporter permease subunit [Candidatus Limnocylindrales bacterium]|jgi:CzcA family heavy metal efflux pump|nr:efflux RND transporter permease subunit [Candidatus Limnocylindrales bacterium]
MMRQIIATSLRFRYIVIAAAAGLMLFGGSHIQSMPVDVFPEFAPPKVEVQTITLGLSASEVESLVTIPLEQALSGIEDLKVLRSKSVAQLSQIIMLFEPGTDLLKARQLVQERITNVTNTLPTWAAPPFMMQPVSATSRVMKIGMSSETVDLIDMSTMSYWTIRARLLGVPGVANVMIYGERLDMLQVQTIPDKMAAHGVAIETVMEATSEALDEGILLFSPANAFGTGGFIETANQRLNVHHPPSILAVEDLAHVKVAGRDGRLVDLREVAELVRDHQPLHGEAVINDGPGIMLIVEKLPWANTLDVTRGVEAAMDELKPGMVGIDVDTTIFRPASFIEIALANLTSALLLGSLLVFFVLVAFLYDWRTALISLVAIPLSLMAAAMVLYFTKTTINTMILAGFVISVGVVVDDAIIDIENIVRRLRQHRLEGGKGSTARIILDASVEVRSAIVYATLIDIVAITPVFFIEGLSGAFFQPLVVAYALAVLASLGVALTVTPALAYILLRNAPIERNHSPIARRLQAAYAGALARIIRTAKPAFATVAAISLLGILVWPQLGQSLLPDFKERDFLMHWVTAPATSHAEETRITIAACNELRTIPGVRNCGAHIGQAFQGDEPYGIEFGENWISIEEAVDYDDTRAAVQEVVDGYPGLRRDVQTYLKERMREVLTGSGDAVVIRIFGEDLQVLRDKAAEVEAALEAVPGMIDVHTEQQVNIPQIQVTVDLAKAERYGIKPGDVRRAAATVVASEEVGDIFYDGHAQDVVVWSIPSARDNVSDIENLLLDAADGSKVRLTDVATVVVAATPGHIGHEQNFRKIDVDGNVAGRDLGAVTRDVEAALAKIEFPLGYHPELLGEYQERQAAQGRLLLFAIAAAIGVFLLLQASFGSTRLALLSFLTLPSALVGGVLAAWVGGGVISLGSLVGFFTVLGIAARNGIMMVNHFQHLEREEGMVFGRDLVIRGARERLSPILMTALATGLALVPLVIAGDLPGHEIEHPLAIVILGGLVTSTLLNLFVVPSLYLRFGRRTSSGDPNPAAQAATA